MILIILMILRKTLINKTDDVNFPKKTDLSVSVARFRSFGIFYSKLLPKKYLSQAFVNLC